MLCVTGDPTTPCDTRLGVTTEGPARVPSARPTPLDNLFDNTGQSVRCRYGLYAPVSPSFGVLVFSTLHLSRVANVYFLIDFAAASDSGRSGL
jgi:hypothetical protein